jgi:hypothetical protein
MCLLFTTARHNLFHHQMFLGDDFSTCLQVLFLSTVHLAANRQVLFTKQWLTATSKLGLRQHSIKHAIGFFTAAKNNSNAII